MGRPARWLLPEVDFREAEPLAAAAGSTLPAARVLLSRGYRDAAAARRFLHPSLDDLHDPMRMAGMVPAVERLRRAIAAREKILLYGDYDVDGTASVVIVRKAIEMAGGAASHHVPHRLKDGYGMRPEVIEAAAREGVGLVISLDTGIRAAEAVCHASRLGVDVIVTDHHLPDAVLPPALAILNPNQPGCEYPEKNLCGAGVAFKLVQALLEALDWPAEKVRRITASFLKLVAIATVADVVPLTGENRVIVKHGLEGLRSVRNPGLRALLDVAGVAPGVVPSTGQVAFQIAPRLNAAGRMADANAIIELLVTGDEERARVLAAGLHSLNRERQEVEAGIVRAVLEECLAVPVTDAQAALVFSAPRWHRGVVGIVASRLVERFHRPVFVLSEDAEEGVSQGSGRSVPAFHLLEALEAMPELFLRFGGHRQAAGVTLPVERVPEFRERLNAYACARLAPESFAAEFEIDAPIRFPEITDRAVAEALAMAPFGCGNSVPVLLAEGVEAAGPPALWKEKHLRVNLRQDRRMLTLKAWNFGERGGEFCPGRPVDVLFSFEPDEFALNQGLPGWCAVLRDVRCAQRA